MVYCKAVLSAVSALLLGILLPTLISFVRFADPEKAIGLGAVAGGLLETLFSPVFWLVTACFFSAFFFASQAKNSALRAIVFWIPASFLTVVAIASVRLYAYAAVHFGR